MPTIIACGAIAGMAAMLVVFLGAGAGGLARYLISLAILRADTVSFPFATLLINLLGCLLVGYLGTFFAGMTPHRETLRLGLIVGVLGGFTTFSSFGRETFELIRHARWPAAITYVLISTLGGLALVVAGHLLARAIHPAAAN